MRSIACCVLLALLLAATPAFGQAAVQRLDVQVIFEGQPPHALVRERVQAAVASVAERLLVGRPLDQATQLQPRLAEAMVGVLERVITGYTIVSAVANVGAVTAVAVRLRPLGDVIREAAVRFDLREIPVRLHGLIPVLLQPVVDQVRLLPLGLPVAADWAYPLLEGQAQTPGPGCRPAHFPVGQESLVPDWRGAPAGWRALVKNRYSRSSRMGPGGCQYTGSPPLPRASPFRFVSPTTGRSHMGRGHPLS